MGTKSKPGRFDCFGNLAEDEPYFVLCARDYTAAGLIEAWADIRAMLIKFGLKPREDMAKVVEARNCAQAMREWREIHRPAPVALDAHLEQLAARGTEEATP